MKTHKVVAYPAPFKSAEQFRAWKAFTNRIADVRWQKVKDTTMYFNDGHYKDWNYLNSKTRWEHIYRQVRSGHKFVLRFSNLQKAVQHFFNIDADNFDWKSATDWVEEHVERGTIWIAD